jgi:endonuclease-3
MAKKELLAAKKKRAAAILRGLRKLYPDATCALHHKSALQLLVATILSAQSTDDTVNKVTPVLFEKYPTAADLAAASTEEIEGIVKSTGFFHQKTKSIRGACKIIAENYGGEVPATMEQLVELPGVARKTANVVLGTWYGRNDGICVDTHVGRLAHRMGLTWTSRDEKDAVKIEQDLLQLIPQKDWTFFGHAMIWHGRRVCSARKPNCAGCGVNKLCPSAFTFETPEAKKARPRPRGPGASGRRKS